MSGYIHLSAITTCCVWVERLIHAREDCSVLKGRVVLFVRELPHPNGGIGTPIFDRCGMCMPVLPVESG
jgi:hypothetical protein